MLFIVLEISNTTQKAAIHLRVRFHIITSSNTISGALYSVGNFQHHLEGCYSSESQITYSYKIQHPIRCSIQCWNFPTPLRRLLFISELDYIQLQLSTPYLVLYIVLEISNTTEKAEKKRDTLSGNVFPGRCIPYCFNCQYLIARLYLVYQRFVLNSCKMKYMPDSNKCLSLFHMFSPSPYITLCGRCPCPSKSLPLLLFFPSISGD